MFSWTEEPCNAYEHAVNDLRSKQQKITPGSIYKAMGEDVVEKFNFKYDIIQSYLQRQKKKAQNAAPAAAAAEAARSGPSRAPGNPEAHVAPLLLGFGALAFLLHFLEGVTIGFEVESRHEMADGRVGARGEKLAPEHVELIGRLDGTVGIGKLERAAVGLVVAFGLAERLPAWALRRARRTGGGC